MNTMHARQGEVEGGRGGWCRSPRLNRPSHQLAAFGLAILLVLLAGGCTTTATNLPPAVAAPGEMLPFEDDTLPVDMRVGDLVSRMTLEEKVAQMQQNAPAIERLGVPAYHWWNEALHGVARNGVATVFPQAIGLAATWNTDLHYRMASVIGVEGRAKHHQALREDKHGIYTGLDFWSPNINIFRDPRWGRGQETYGEDPFLTGRFGVAFVKGLQGDDPQYFRLIATPKHFAVHSGPESERHRINVDVSETDLWSTYLPAFEACIREGHAYSVMAAYNSTDGLPCCANPRLLTEILRQQWGFTGYVVSDVDAIADISRSHQTTDTAAEAAAMAVKAGCDLNGGSTYDSLTAAVHLGLISEAEIDQSVKRLMTARIKLGEFDVPDDVSYAQIPYEVNDDRAHDQLARDVARQSMVLLKNAGNVLPLKKDLKNIAVIGPDADSLEALTGNYYGKPSHPVTVLQGIRDAVGLGTRVTYVKGSPLVTENLELEEIVSGKCLFTDDTCTTSGLKGDYFSNIACAGRPFLTRYDGIVDFDWSLRGVRDPGAALSVRWTGILVAPETGTYQIGINGKDGYRIYIDNKLVVDSWYAGARHSTGARLNFEQGKAYALRIEYFQADTRPLASAQTAGTAAKSQKPELRSEGSVQLKWTRPSAEPFYAPAVLAARNADAVVLVLGLTADIEGEEMNVNYEGFSGGDRTSLDLPRCQEELLEQVTAAAAESGKPVVLVLMSGSALSVNWAEKHVPAIMEAWYPGQQGGHAVADVIFGDCNPAGRLPVTFYKSVNDLPAFEDYALKNRTYRYFTGQPIWPFGFGLSYTTFAYRDLEVGPESPATTDNVIVRAKIKNTGARAGDEVVQLYAGHMNDRLPAPVQSLQGFKRVSLNPGEEKVVDFTLTPYQLSVINLSGKRVVVPGTVQIRVGGSSAGGLTANVRVRGETVEPSYQVIEPKVK